MMELTENGIFAGEGIIPSPICDSIMDFVLLVISSKYYICKRKEFYIMKIISEKTGKERGKSKYKISV